MCNDAENVQVYPTDSCNLIDWGIWEYVFYIHSYWLKMEFLVDIRSPYYANPCWKTRKASQGLISVFILSMLIYNEEGIQ